MRFLVKNITPTNLSKNSFKNTRISYFQKDELKETLESFVHRKEPKEVTKRKVSPRWSLNRPSIEPQQGLNRAALREQEMRERLTNETCLLMTIKFIQTKKTN